MILCDMQHETRLFEGKRERGKTKLMIARERIGNASLIATTTRTRETTGVPLFAFMHTGKNLGRSRLGVETSEQVRN
jgi:hypothetical protein